MRKQCQRNLWDSFMHVFSTTTTSSIYWNTHTQREREIGGVLHQKYPSYFSHQWIRNSKTPLLTPPITPTPWCASEVPVCCGKWKNRKAYCETFTPLFLYHWSFWILWVEFLIWWLWSCVGLVWRDWIQRALPPFISFHRTKLKSKEEELVETTIMIIIV